MAPIRRVIVIGPPGAGKTRFSRALSEKIGVPAIHLDSEFFLPNYVYPEPSVWAKRVEQIAKLEEWIIDGNFFKTMKYRIDRADTIIYLDYSPIICSYRFIKRIISNYGKYRSDLGQIQRLNIPHLVRSINYKHRKRNLIRHTIDQSRIQGLNVFQFKRPREAEQFLNLENLGKYIEQK